MISPELIRRYPFFAGLDNDRVVALAKLSNEATIPASAYFFHEGEPVDSFYLLVEGAVAIVLEVPDRDSNQPVADQLAGEMKMKDVTVSTVGTGNIFGWPALIPPHEATASARALTDCRVYAFDCKALRQLFDQDYQFAYLLTLRAAQVMRERLRDLQIESLAFTT
jgi:CRP-like cAMP-binding protein